MNSIDIHCNLNGGVIGLGFGVHQCVLTITSACRAFMDMLVSLLIL